ncbi:hypothetical protein TNCV_3324521 [Trichonephila clavipes]|nr:hypothetical protein TNCV_3324521 [Trichonephila clavipes]
MTRRPRVRFLDSHVGDGCRRGFSRLLTSGRGSQMVMVANSWLVLVSRGIMSYGHWRSPCREADARVKSVVSNSSRWRGWGEVWRKGIHLQ